jgi:hypothetical protein
VGWWQSSPFMMPEARMPIETLRMTKFLCMRMVPEQHVKQYLASKFTFDGSLANTASASAE